MRLLARAEGAESDHYAVCEVSLLPQPRSNVLLSKCGVAMSMSQRSWPLSEIKTCIIEGFRGVGLQARPAAGQNSVRWKPR